MAKDGKESEFVRGADFDRNRVKRLRQADQTWEADFRALPKPVTQSETHYLGLIVSAQGGAVLARSRVEGRPTADDLAALLAGAMMRPLTGSASRPGRLHVRGHRQWRGLFPHLEALGIEVSVRQELPNVQIAYEDRVRQVREARRVGMVRPTATQSAVEEAFPAIAEWVRSRGHIEIGEQETFGFVVRAIDAGGVIFEDDKPGTLAEAMAALEKALAAHFEQEVVE